MALTLSTRQLRLSARISSGAIVTALLLGGCTGGDAPSGETAAAPASLAPEAAVTPAPEPLLDGPVASVTTPGRPAPDYVDRILASGLDAGTAAVLAATKSTVDVIDGHTFVLRQDYPTGEVNTATVHLFAQAPMSPSDPPVVTVDEIGEDLRYTILAAIDTADMPSDMRAQIANGLPAEPPTSAAVSPARAGSPAVVVPLGPATPAIRLAAPAIAVVADDDLPRTIGLLVDGVVSQVQESRMDNVVKGVEALGFSNEPTAVWEAFKAGKKVADALEANPIVADALTELDTLEECAKNPTAPVTKQEYERNPAAQQQILGTITAARRDMRLSAVALFVTMGADTASGLAAEVPWLGFVVGPLANDAKDGLQRAIQRDLERARQAVVSCRPNAYRVSGKIPMDPIATVVTGEICRLDREFTTFADGAYVGRFTFRPADIEGGSVQFKGKVFNAPFKVTGSGDYRVALSPDGSSGTIDFAFTSTIKIPVVGDQTGTGPVTLTLTSMPPCGTVPGD